MNLGRCEGGIKIYTCKSILAAVEGAFVLSKHDRHVLYIEK